jgi:hypothetical protein
MVPALKSEQVIQLAFRVGTSFCAREQSPIHVTVDRAFFMRKHGKPAGREMNGRDCDGQLATDTDDAALSDESWKGQPEFVEGGNEARSGIAGSTTYDPCLWSPRKTWSLDPGDALNPGSVLNLTTWTMTTSER